MQGKKVVTIRNKISALKDVNSEVQEPSSLATRNPVSQTQAKDIRVQVWYNEKIN